MYQKVRQNFEEKVSYLASMIAGMMVIEHHSFLFI